MKNFQVLNDQAREPFLNVMTTQPSWVGGVDSEVHCSTDWCWGVKKIRITYVKPNHVQDASLDLCVDII